MRGGLAGRCFADRCTGCALTPDFAIAVLAVQYWTVS